MKQLKIILIICCILLPILCLTGCSGDGAKGSNSQQAAKLKAEMDNTNYDVQWYNPFSWGNGEKKKKDEANLAFLEEGIKADEKSQEDLKGLLETLKSFAPYIGGGILLVVVLLIVGRTINNNSRNKAMAGARQSAAPPAPPAAPTPASMTGDLSAGDMDMFQ